MYAYPDIQMRIGDGLVSVNERASREVINPSTEEVIGRVPAATADDLDRAISAAESAFHEWKRVSAFDRALLIRRAADLLRERVEVVAQTMTLENGKTLPESRGEVLVCADTLEWLADEARRSYGRVIPSRYPDGRCLVLREPVGPVAAFTPWNAPGLTVIRKVGTAIAAGCSVVLKPSEETPGTAVHIAEAFADAGLPAGVFQLVFGNSAMVSTHLLASPVFRKVTFTGSVEVGKTLVRHSVDTLKRTTMELGGHAPVIVCDDADIDLAVREMAAFKVRHSGQVCAAPSRFYVARPVYDRFVAGMTERMGAIRVGDGLDPQIDMGPLANQRRLDAMLGFVDDAIAKGGRITTGGHRIGERGFFFEPTVIADATDDMDVVAGEIFGPIAPIVPFDEVDDAIARANASTLGLTAFVFTGSEPLSRHLVNSIEAGLVALNTGGTSLPELPFGGVKESGYGYEGGTEGIEAYEVRKLVNAY